jgi:hypothetical protein
MKIVDFCAEVLVCFSTEAVSCTRHNGSSVTHDAHKYEQWTLIFIQELNTSISREILIPVDVPCTEMIKLLHEESELQTEINTAS